MAVKSFDLRRNRTVYPIASKVVDLTLDYTSNATTISKDVTINGTIMDIFFTVPDLDAGTQCTLYLIDEDNAELYNSGLVDESATHHLTPGISLDGPNQTTVKVVTADNQTANRTFKVKIKYA